MKKVVVLTMGAALLLSSCGTYTESGAYTGGMFGSIIGSAIGGISGGPRGSDVGTLIGMAGGAVVGAAIGSAADQRMQEERAARAEARAEARAQARAEAREHASHRGYDNRDFGRDGGRDDYGYDGYEGPADDRIDFQSGKGENEFRSQSVPAPVGLNAERDGISISNVRFVDGNGNDNVISSNELCKISFEVRNNTSRPIYNVRPQVIETSGNRHIRVSQGICVEQIAPKRGVRYTAMVKADGRLRNGTATFRVSVDNPATGRAVEIDNIEITTRN